MTDEATEPKAAGGSTPEGTAVEEDPVKKRLSELRESIIRTARSQQLPIADLIDILKILDGATELPPGIPGMKGAKIKDKDGKDVQPSLNDFKLTSEGSPYYVPPPGVTVEAPNSPPAQAANGPVAEPQETRRHRTR